MPRSAARSLALRRLAYAGGGLLIPFVIPAIVSTLFRQNETATLIAGGAALAVGAGCFFYALYRWRPRCPACHASRARFVRAGEIERLRCEHCGYDEPTGWTYSGTP